MKPFDRWFKSSANHDDITQTIERAFTAAGLDTQSGPMQSVSETIRRALGAVGIKRPAHDDSVIDVTARVIDTPTQPARAPINDDVKAPGTFTTHQFSNHAGSRAYKLYVPNVPLAEPMPMIVMLHGCTQSADDFAAGTRMNRLADQHGFLVVYPEQNQQANSSKCWNWFSSPSQRRDSGEASLIADITREVMKRHRVDTRRVFVAGLSAGAAMAVIMAETYPDLYAAVGAHSGLPYGAAHDVPSALAAMKASRNPATPRSSPRPRQHGVPLIVFHGDQDHTVQLSNGEAIIQQTVDAHRVSALQTDIEQGSAKGRRYSKTVYADTNGRALIESWTVHGAGHAWFGGDPRGSYTDATGPDASAEMLRFFLGVQRQD